MSICSRFIGSVASSSNRPPLNQGTASNPTRPPVDMAANSDLAMSSNSPGEPRECRSILVNMSSGSSPASSANMQNTRRLTKCATASGLWPLSRSDCASSAKVAAAFAVSVWRVISGRRRSGALMAHLSLLRAAGSARSSRTNSWTRLTALVQLVWMRNRAMSETIRSGGFSSARAYCLSCPKARSRLACRPLYSHAKWWRFQTSAQPSPPPSLRAPFSKL